MKPAPLSSVPRTSSYRAGAHALSDDSDDDDDLPSLASRMGGFSKAQDKHVAATVVKGSDSSPLAKPQTLLSEERWVNTFHKCLTSLLFKSWMNCLWYWALGPDVGFRLKVLGCKLKLLSKDPLTSLSIKELGRDFLRQWLGAVIQYWLIISETL